MNNFYVYCPACGEEHNSSEVETVNIEEDFTGRDVLTYTCKYTNTVQKSLIYQGYS